MSGLSAAFYLLKETSCRVTIVEASSRIGGWISSQAISNDILFEQGARTLRPIGDAGLNTLELLDDLKLSRFVNPIHKSHPAARNRYIFTNDTLYPLPTRLPSLFTKQPPFSKPLIAAVWHDLKAAPKIADDDTIYEFSKRRFGQEVADYLISPLICGICAGDAKAISVRFLMDKMFEREQTYGSVVKGSFRELFKSNKSSPSAAAGSSSPSPPPRLPLTSLFRGNDEVMGQAALHTKAVMEGWVSYSLKGGMYRLPQTLADHIERKGGEIRLNSRCERVSLTNKSIVLNDDRELDFDYLISSLPAHKLAPLLKNEHEHIANDLESVPHVTVATVNLAYKGKLLAEEGFGFLVPPMENLPLLGITFDSCFNTNSFIYAQEDDHDQWTVLTAMLGGFAFERHFGKSPTEQMLLETASRYVRDILSISADPVYSRVSVLVDCIPQYVVGHRKRIDRIFDTIRDDQLPLFLIGTAYHGVGVNDVILSAKKVATQLKQLST